VLCGSTSAWYIRGGEQRGNEELEQIAAVMVAIADVFDIIISV